MLSLNSLQPIRGVVSQYATFFGLPGQLKRFAVKVPLRLETSRFIVKTATNWAELELALRLRYDVFHRESMGIAYPLGLDVDALDVAADHLLIEDRATGRIVGNYRLVSSTLSSTFYSESEFAMRWFLSVAGNKLELSRACIDRDFRTGAVIHLLWRGLTQYAEMVGARFLFGCTSVKTTRASKAIALYQELQARGHVDSTYEIAPLPGYRLPASPRVVVPADELEALIPALLKAYLRAGAKVSSPPALDRAFQCVDFLTILDRERLQGRYDRKYGA